MVSKTQVVQSWGRTVSSASNVIPIYWRHEHSELSKVKGSILAAGNLRSYGDSCLNDQGTILSTTTLDRFISFDSKTGVLHCESGVTLEQIIQFALPHGFFVPITLGTKCITVGGAIANDVHGKNHHLAGTFGCHVDEIELVRDGGAPILCSPSQHSDLFCATIGGLGLTGLILSAKIRLRKVESSFLDTEMIQFSNLEEYFELVQDSDHRFEHTSAWADFLTLSTFGRGIFLRGNFLKKEEDKKNTEHAHPISVPFLVPEILLNKPCMKIFNWLYFQKLPSRVVHTRTHYDTFFFPLDVIGQWHRLYGKRGFFQYQFVLPKERTEDGMEEVLHLLRNSYVRPFLTVLKTFGAVRSPGLLSFPMEGLTVALDFPNLFEATASLFEHLDRIVAGCGGRVYPAKDARMSATRFQQFFPHWRQLEPHMASGFSSSFWRRVTSA